MRKILHISPLDKFISPYIEFVKTHFAFEEHAFVLIGDINMFPVKLESNIYLCNRKMQIFPLIWKMIFARKIILHSLCVPRIVKLLAIQPWLLNKCYWLIWGGDLYHYNMRAKTPESDKYEATRAFVIKRIGHLVTYVKGDYHLAQEWYSTRGLHHKCLLYTSNIYTELAVPPKTGKTINVLVGNSAAPTNEHMEILEKLAVFKDANMVIYCPLSYGGTDLYMKKIVEKGKELFSNNFIPLTEYMHLPMYLDLLGQIDIAVFAHRRQQAMGNTITLLGLGKKVFMRRDVAQWPLFTGVGVKVFDVDSIDINPIDQQTALANKKNIAERFSEKRLIADYQEIFK